MNEPERGHFPFPVKETHIEPVADVIRQHLNDPVHPEIIKILKATRENTDGLTETGMFRIIHGAIQKIRSK
jgi:hypothetical protein